ncbi:PAS domain-containing protein [Cercophora newfieldiana]|uniref:PAS domain-containing protein n=1 Tax=Cercophora newfieldiana TaxID=92897 RepID=A0AA40CS85_9PEZI|nr:PAS domain-containing protein [Cercophora newfieldiana]
MNYYSPTLSSDNVQQQQQQQHQHQQQQQQEHHRQMASQQRAQQQRHAAARDMAMINTATTQAAVLGGPLSALSDIPMSGDSLDDIVFQNSNELNRRRSVPHPYSGHAPLGENGSDRPLSMLDFGQGNNDFPGYSFADMGSHGEVMGGGYGMGDIGMPGHSGSYGQSTIMAMSDQADFNISSDMMGSMAGFSNLNVASMGADPNALHLFSSSNMGHQYPPTTIGSVNNDFAMNMNIEDDPISATSAHPANGLVSRVDDDMTGVDGTYGAEDVLSPQTQAGTTMDQSLTRFHPNIRQSVTQDGSEFRSPASGTPRTAQIATPSGSSMPVSNPMTPATTAASEQPANEKKSIYSKSGFDMLRALWYVATRKNQKLNIGAVDMSCAFVVCDVSINDCPIIYVSDNFQNLTGYNRHEIVGKNCRFLQAPDGNVEAGSKRDFVENHAVLNLKESIARGEEIQQSLINYRKGGKPFLNLLTMIPIPWDTDEIRYFIGFQIDLVECPEAISGHEANGAMQVDYARSDIGQYIWDPPNQSQWEPENGQTLGIDDVSTLLQSFNPRGVTSDWHKQSWDKMLLENADDVIHVCSLKGLFLYISPSCKKILEYDPSELMGNGISSICHPSDTVPLGRELKEAQHNVPVNLVFRIRRKHSGYTWFESYGNLFSDQGKGRKCIVLVGRKRPVYVLQRKELEANGGIGDSEIWTKVSTSGMFLFVSSNVRSLLDLVPGDLEGTSMQDLMRKETRPEFGRTIEKARRGKIVSCKHEIQNKRGQVLQAHTTFYPGDASEGEKPSFLLAQTKLLKASSRAIAPATANNRASTTAGNTQDDPASMPLGSISGNSGRAGDSGTSGNSDSSPEATTSSDPLPPGTQDVALAADTNVFEELKTTRCTSWQFELRQMEKNNRILAEELAQLLSNRKKRKRRKGSNMVRDCANCHTRSTPEWRRGPSGQRDLCNSCGLRWAKQNGRVSPRNSSRGNGDGQSKKSNSPIHSSPLHREFSSDMPSLESNSKAATTPMSATATDDQFTTPTQVPSTPIAMSAPTKAGVGNNGAHFNPPQSRPLLEGGSGHGGGGMEMTAIQEEREASA